MDSTTTDVVVGAGLVAARDLRAAGYAVTVLEARNRVGGRVLGHRFADGTRVELGGQWVGPTQDRALALVDGLSPRTFPTHVDGAGLAALHCASRSGRSTGRAPRRPSSGTGT